MTDLITDIELFDPMHPGVLTSPNDAYRRLRDRRPVAFLEPLNVWVVSRYADVRDVLTAPEAFSAALAFGKDSVLTDTRGEPGRQLNLRFAGDSGGVVSSTDGQAHVRLRRMVARLMSKPRLDALDAELASHVGAVVSGLAAGGAGFDVVADLAKPVAVKAIGDIIGLGDDVAGALARWADTTFRALDPCDELSGPAMAQQVTWANLKCARVVTTALDAGSRSDVPNGLFEAWREAGTAGEREEVLLSVLQLFQAGYETIVSAICFTIGEFVLDGADQSGLLSLSGADAPVLASVFEESLRLGSPVRATFRTAVGARTIGGSPIPDGATVMLLLGSANRDERVFDAPDEARPGARSGHVAFGAGPHRCLGRFLAHLELGHVVRTLMSTVSRLSADGPARVSANILKAGHERMPVHAEWR